MSYSCFRVVPWLLGATLLFQAGLAAAQAPARNPFVRPSAALPKPAAAAAPAFPPSLKLPPLILPPPMGALNAGASPATPPAFSPPAVPSVEGSLARPKPFMSRQEIEQARARCSVAFSEPRSLQVSAEQAEHTLQFKGGANCLTAVSTDGDWLDARVEAGGSVSLHISQNQDVARRAGHVTVVTPHQTFRVSVTQAAAATPAPAPTPAHAQAADPVRPPLPVESPQELSAQ